MTIITKIFVLILFVVSINQSYSQEYTFEDFVGTWHGTIMSPSTNGAAVPMTMTIESDGFYTETSGALMPTLYPNTQECEFEASTNRFHWWYLQTVYAGQYFYQHFFYEIVYFNNDTLEMHYNFWDDPEPHPEVGTIFIVRENLTPAPSNLEGDFLDNIIALTWNEPVLGNGGMANPSSYKIFYKLDENAITLLETTVTNSFAHENVTYAGTHSYYVIAVYSTGESDPSNQVDVLLSTPAPENLQSQLLANNVVLNWDEPENNLPMAGLSGYNIYHKLGEGEFELLMFAEDNYYAHEEISAGVHYYYVTAVYDGAESDPSNEVMVELIISAIQDEMDIKTTVYPNPASDNVTIQSEFEMQSIKIYNQSGQVIQVLQVDSQKQQINVNNLPAGLYVFTIETDQGTISKRIFVQ